MNTIDTFASLNYDTRPTTASTDVITVKMNGDMVDAYAHAYLQELYRRNPIRAESVNLTEEDIRTYFRGILALRIKKITNQLAGEWRLAKSLLIPSFIEYVISCVGEVYDSDKGLLIQPETDLSYDLDFMMSVSTRLRAFKADGILLHEDAFPRTNEGDPETMSMAIINEYVYSMEKTAHPVASYVAAWLGSKLKEEVAFKALYRIRYDDIAYIANRLMNDEKVMI